MNGRQMQTLYAYLKNANTVGELSVKDGRMALLFRDAKDIKITELSWATDVKETEKPEYFELSWLKERTKGMNAKSASMEDSEIYIRSRLLDAAEDEYGETRRLLDGCLKHMKTADLDVQFTMWADDLLKILKVFEILGVNIQATADVKHKIKFEDVDKRAGTLWVYPEVIKDGLGKIGLHTIDKLVQEIVAPIAAIKSPNAKITLEGGTNTITLWTAEVNGLRMRTWMAPFVVQED
jgi:hypothetical protein